MDVAQKLKIFFRYEREKVEEHTQGYVHEEAKVFDHFRNHHYFWTQIAVHREYTGEANKVSHQTQNVE